MKKITKIFFIVLIAVFGFTMTPKLFADSIPNWEFLPVGPNYLDPDNFSVGGESSYFEVSTFNPFCVKSSQVYTLFATYSSVTSFGQYFISAYDANNTFITSSFSFSEELDDYDNVIAITFTTTSATKYIDLSFEIFYEGNDGATFYPIDEYIVFSEGTSYPGTQEEVIFYEGPSIDYDPVISGNNGYYYTDVNNPVSVATIKSGLIAMDDVDGDITSSIVVYDDDYTAFSDTLGEYPVVFQVTDSSNNQTLFTVYVIVVDNEDPVITGTANYTFKETSLVPLSHFQSALSATDNYDGNLTSQIVVSADNYSSNYNVLGTHTIIFSVTDGSNNVGTFTVYVKVEDGTAPVFSGPTSINKGNSASLTLSEILSQITALDAVDGNVTHKIVVESDNYSRNASRVGDWEIELSVQDVLLNTAFFTVTISVSDIVSPIFMINQQVITIELNDNHLGVQDFVKVLVKTQAIKENSEVVVISDNYSENKNTPGTYQVVLGVGEEQMELEINVIEGLYEQLQEDNPTVWEKIINWIVKAWELVKQFFVNLFEIIFK